MAEKEFYIDMHDHILPGVDDGSQSMEESLKLIEMEYNEGVRKIIFTPHYMRHRNSYTYDELDKVFENMKAEVKKIYPDMELYLGNEVLYENGIVDDIQKEDMIHMMAGGRYMLMEFNIKIPYGELFDAVKRVTETRKKIILAHVERYRCLTGHIERIEELNKLGIYLQINADSVDGSFFDENVRWCRKLIKEGYIYFISTDAHDLENRTPVIRDALKWIKKKCGEDTAERLFRANAQAVIDNERIDI